MTVKQGFIMPKPSRQTIIDEIIKGIEQGLSRGKLLSKIVKKWQMSDRTFDRHLKIANQQHAELQQKAKAAADLAYIQSSEEAAKKAVMSKAERLAVLTQIARCEVSVKAGDAANPVEVIVPVDTLERIKAIAEINKMEGDYAETSIKLKGDKENPLFDLANATVIFK